jgi:hypothetical protein
MRETFTTSRLALGLLHDVGHCLAKHRFLLLRIRELYHENWMSVPVTRNMSRAEVPWSEDLLLAFSFFADCFAGSVGGPASYSRAHVPAVSRGRVGLLGGGLDDNGVPTLEWIERVRVVGEGTTGRSQNDARRRLLRRIPRMPNALCS